MSYCRANADSDVYAYANIFGGYDILAAAYRDLPARSRKVSTLVEFHAAMMELRDLGYRVPQSALDRIERELTEETC